MSRYCAPVLAICAAATLLAPAAHAQSPLTPGSSFFEKFERLSLSRWKISNGWSNGGSFTCTWRAENVRIAEPNGLQLNLTKSQGGAMFCGEIQSTQTYRFGVLEARINAAKASGTSSALFMFTHPGPGRPYQDINSGILGINATGAPVDVAIVWTPERISFYENQKLVRELRAPQDPIPQDPMLLDVNLHSRQESWMGPLQVDQFPLTTTVEWLAYTAPGQTCLFPQSITCKLNLASAQ